MAGVAGRVHVGGQGALTTNTGSISLENLCQLLNVSFDPGKAHHASYDANVTADALTELLKYAAQSGPADLESCCATTTAGQR